MRKEKRFSWPKIGANATYIGGDMFTDEDQATNYIVVQDINVVHEGKTIRVLIQNRLKTGYTVYSGVVKDGKCEFLLGSKDLSSQTFVFSARIIDGNQIASTCTMSYNVCMVNLKGNAVIPEEEVNYIEELLKKLDDAIIAADAKIIEIIAEGDKQITRLSTECDTQILRLKDEGVTQVKLVNDAGAHNVTITEEAGSQVGAAIEQITNRSIANLVAEGRTQTAAVSAEGVKQVNAVSSEGTKQIEVVAAEGVKQTNTIKAEGVNQAGIITAEGIKQTSTVTAEGTKQAGIVSGKGNEIVAAADAKIAEINQLGGQGFNVRTKMTFYTWLGNKAQFDAIFLKPNNTQYSLYNANSTLINQYFINVNPATYYDKRISLVVQGGPNGIEMFNKPSDPMPIKTLNNNGLKVYEETEDYIIQIDKDAVVTLVESYVVGTFDIYKERLADVERSIGLLDLHKIAWDANIDNAKLLLDVNKEQLEVFANTPSFLPESERPVLETRAIPTSYECCVRTDKKTGEIYIGEGYENLFDSKNLRLSTAFANSGANLIKNDKHSIKYEQLKVVNNDSIYEVFTGSMGIRQAFNGENLSFSGSFKGSFGGNGVTFKGYFNPNYPSAPFNEADGKIYSTLKNITFNGDLQIGLGCNIGVFNPMSFENSNICLTKTSTPKPFVKNIMPIGKLSFITNATSETHSFVMKDTTNSTVQNYLHFLYAGTIRSFRPAIDIGTYSGKVFEFILSKTYNSVFSNTNNYKLYLSTLVNETEGVLEVGNPVKKQSINSFKQLLIYKGNLTEAELKAENKKNVKVNLAEVR